MSSRTYSLNAYEVATTSSIADVDTSIPVELVAGLTVPLYLVIDPDDPTVREYIKVTTLNGNNLDVGTTGNRGLAGSAGGTAHPHASGARVRAVPVHQWLDDLFFDIEALEGLSGDFMRLNGSTPMAATMPLGANRIADVADPTADQDATTRVYVNGQDLLLLPLSGARAMTGALDMGTNLINNVVNPVDPQDAATMLYVDTADAALQVGIDAKVAKSGDTMTGELVLATAALLRIQGAGNDFTIDQSAGNLRLGRPAVDYITLEDAGTGNEGVVLVRKTTINDGTAGNPQLVFAGDPNTGPYSEGADLYGISTGGVKRVTVGAATDGGVKTNILPFHAVRSGADSLYVMENTASPNFFRFRITNAGALQLQSSPDNSVWTTEETWTP